jgi:hypothetical protein
MKTVLVLGVQEPLAREIQVGTVRVLSMIMALVVAVVQVRVHQTRQLQIMEQTVAMEWARRFRVQQWPMVEVEAEVEVLRVLPVQVELEVAGMQEL